MRSLFFVSCFLALHLTVCCDYQVEIIPEAVQYSAMVINSSLIKAYEANAADLDIQFEPVRADVPRGSTDMGNVSHVVPSIHPMYSVGRNALNHTREFTEASGLYTTC